MRARAIATVAVMVFWARPVTADAPQLLKSGDSFSCNMEWSVTVYESNGTRSQHKAKLKELIRVSATEIEVTKLWESGASKAAHPISELDGASAYARYTDGVGVPHLATLHVLNQDHAIYSDFEEAYRNQGGGVTFASESGSCLRVR